MSSARTVIKVASWSLVALFLAWVVWGYVFLIRPLEAPRIASSPANVEVPPLSAASNDLARKAPFRVEAISGRNWVKDDLGRVAILRGVGVGQGSKIPPFLPLPTDNDIPFRQLRSWGVNAIRYAVPWEALEPKPKTYDEAFIDKLGKILDMAQANDILVLLDLHQDMFSRCFSGDGAPIWATRPGLVSEEDLAKNCMYMGWLDIMNGTRQMKAWADFWMGDWTPDDTSLQDHLIEAWMKVVERYHAHPAVFGYNLLNEPYGFYGVLRALDPVDGDVESKYITPFYGRFATRIRAVDPDSVISFEPTVRVPEYSDWFGMGNTIGSIDLPNLLWAPHFYDIWQLYKGCDAHYDRKGTGIHPFVEEMQKQADAKFKAAFVLAEFGVHPCKQGADEDLLHQMTEVEDAMIGSFVWNYFLTGETWGMTGPREGGEDMSLVTPYLYETPDYPAGTPRCMVRHFVRPYPMRIAGEPLRFSFDESFENYGDLKYDYHGADPSAEIKNTGRFVLEFRETGVQAETTVFVPHSFHFPNGAIVTVSDGTAAFQAENADILVWTTDPKEPRHSLTIDPAPTPAPAGDGVAAAPKDTITVGASGPAPQPPAAPGPASPSWFCDPGTRPKK